MHVDTWSWRVFLSTCCSSLKCLAARCKGSPSEHFKLHSMQRAALLGALLGALLVVMGHCARIFFTSDASYRRHDDYQLTDADDIVCIGLLTAYVEKGGQGLRVVGGAYHASPLVDEVIPNDPIIDYVVDNDLFPFY